MNVLYVCYSLEFILSDNVYYVKYHFHLILTGGSMNRHNAPIHNTVSSVLKHNL